jgi:hypothetical protein
MRFKLFLTAVGGAVALAALSRAEPLHLVAHEYELVGAAFPNEGTQPSNAHRQYRGQPLAPQVGRLHGPSESRALVWGAIAANRGSHA